MCYFFSFQSTQSEILLQFYTKLNFFFLHCIDAVKEFLFFEILNDYFFAILLNCPAFCHFLKLNVIVIVLNLIFHLLRTLAELRGPAN